MRDRVTSSDGTQVELFDEGRGPAIVVVHGGSQHASDWADVASHLVDRFRVIRIERSIYTAARSIAQHTMEREVDDVVAVVARVGEPVVLLGHSSGGVVALEVARRCPTSLVGVFLYEPPVAVDVPLGGEALARAEAAIARSDPSEAMAIHLRDIVGFSSSLVWIARRVSPVWREMCAPAAAQMADCRAIESLGVGLERYAALDMPALLLGGGRSPAHLRRRLEALARMLPRSRTVNVRLWGHLANLWSPRKLANIVGEFAEGCFQSQSV